SIAERKPMLRVGFLEGLSPAPPPRGMKPRWGPHPRASARFARCAPSGRAACEIGHRLLFRSPFEEVGARPQRFGTSLRVLAVVVAIAACGGGSERSARPNEPSSPPVAADESLATREA